MYKELYIQYICFKPSRYVCIDVYFWYKVRNKMFKLLLTRVKDNLKDLYIKPKTNRVLKNNDPLHIICERIFSEIGEIYRFLKDTVNGRLLEYARIIGIKNLRNTLFIPMPLKRIYDLENEINNVRDLLYMKIMLEEVFGRKFLENPNLYIKNFMYNVLYLKVLLANKYPYIFTFDRKPEPVYMLLYRIDEGFKQEVERIVREQF